MTPVVTFSTSTTNAGTSTTTYIPTTTTPAAREPTTTTTIAQPTPTGTTPSTSVPPTTTIAATEATTTAGTSTTGLCAEQDLMGTDGSESVVPVKDVSVTMDSSSVEFQKFGGESTPWKVSAASGDENAVKPTMYLKLDGTEGRSPPRVTSVSLNPDCNVQFVTLIFTLTTGEAITFSRLLVNQGYISFDGPILFQCIRIAIVLEAPVDDSMPVFSVSPRVRGCFPGETNTVVTPIATTAGTTTTSVPLTTTPAESETSTTTAQPTPSVTTASTSVPPTTTIAATEATTTAGTSTTGLCPEQDLMGTDGSESVVPVKDVSVTMDSSSVEFQKFGGESTPWKVSAASGDENAVKPTMYLKLDGTEGRSPPRVSSVSLNPDCNVQFVTLIFTLTTGEAITFSRLLVNRGYISFDGPILFQCIRIAIVLEAPVDDSMPVFSVSPRVRGCFPGETNTVVTPIATTAGTTTTSVPPTTTPAASETSTTTAQPTPSVTTASTSVPPTTTIAATEATTTAGTSTTGLCAEQDLMGTDGSESVVPVKDVSVTMDSSSVEFQKFGGESTPWKVSAASGDENAVKPTMYLKLDGTEGRSPPRVTSVSLNPDCNVQFVTLIFTLTTGEAITFSRLLVNRGYISFDGPILFQCIRIAIVLEAPVDDSMSVYSVSPRVRGCFPGETNTAVTPIATTAGTTTTSVPPTTTPSASETSTTTAQPTPSVTTASTSVPPTTFITATEPTMTTASIANSYPSETAVSTSVPSTTFAAVTEGTTKSTTSGGSTSIQTTLTSTAIVLTTTVPSTKPQYCSDPFEYTECLCHKTCNDMAQSSTTVCATLGDSTCQMGCQCPEGMVMNNGTCITGTDCPCYYNERFYQFGEQVSSTTEKCVTLSCTVHGMMRSFDPVCASTEMCTNGRVFQQCPCEKTCQQPNHVCEMALCIAGCACAPGLLWNGSSCVEQPQCYCFANDVMYANNDRWTVDECTLCSCVKGSQTCSEYCGITEADCNAQGKTMVNRDLQDGICCRCVSNNAHCMFENEEKSIGSSWHVGLCESYECALSSDGTGTIVKTVMQCMECQSDERLVFTQDRCCPYCIKEENATTTTSAPLYTTPFSPGTTIGLSTLFTTTSAFTTTGFHTVGVTGSPTIPPEIEYSSTTPTSTGTTIFTSSLPPSTTVSGVPSRVCNEVMHDQTQLPDSRIEIYPSSLGSADVVRGPDALGLMATPADQPMITVQLSQPGSTSPTLLQSIGISGNVKLVRVALKKTPEGEFEPHNGGENIDVTSGAVSFTNDSPDGILVYGFQLTLVELISPDDLFYAARIQVYACVNGLVETTTTPGTTPPGITTPPTVAPGTTTISTPDLTETATTGTTTTTTTEATTTTTNAVTTSPNYEDVTGTGSPTPPPFETEATTIFTTGIGFTTSAETTSPGAALPGTTTVGSTVGTTISPPGTCSEVMTDESKLPGSRIELSPPNRGSPSSLRGPTAEGWSATEQDEPAITIELTPLTSSEPTLLEKLSFYGNVANVSVMVQTTKSGAFEPYNGGEPIDVTSGKLTFATGTETGIRVFAVQVLLLDAIMSNRPFAVRLQVYACIPETAELTTVGTTTRRTTVPGTITPPAEITGTSVTGTTQPPGTTLPSAAPTQAPTTPCKSESTDKCTYGGSVYDLNSVWTDPKSRCMACSCTTGGVTCQNLRESCDLTCSGELIKVEGFCCPVCQPKSELCSVASVETSPEIDGCTPDELINQTTCSGSCTSTVETSLTSSALTSSFRACQALTSEEVTVQMTCAGGEKKSHTYTKITSCGCGTSCMCANPASTFPFQ